MERNLLSISSAAVHSLSPHLETRPFQQQHSIHVRDWLVLDHANRPLPDTSHLGVIFEKAELFNARANLFSVHSADSWKPGA